MALNPGHSDVPNALLERLPPGLREEITARGERLLLSQHQVLYTPGARLTKVYFPFASMISLLYATTDGRTVEIVNIASEGMLGIFGLLTGALAEFQAVVQLPGPALRLDMVWLRRAITADREARDLFSRYSRFMTLQIAQQAICNTLHRVDQRCCRWLLASSDRLHTDLLPLTHDYLALMLGVRRAGVTAVLDQLQRDGLLRQQPSRIGLTDRPALKARACECYQAVQRHFEALVDAPPRTAE
jgi:CRP-like cAMP-binding protein